jgi:hypothetical protein
MSHCRNSWRRIKYFYIVAFLSVWKNFPLKGEAWSGVSRLLGRVSKRLFPCKQAGSTLRKDVLSRQLITMPYRQ